MSGAALRGRAAREFRSPVSSTPHGIIPNILGDEIDIRRLVDECVSGVPEAWRQFVAHFNPVIQAAVLRTLRQCGQPAAGLVDDLVQEAYLRICANRCRVLRDFRKSEPSGLYGLLQSVAISVTFDHIRAALTKKRGSGQKPVSMESEAGVSVPDLEGPRVAENRVLFREVDEHLRAILPGQSAARDRQIFWLYHRHGWTAVEIAALPGVGLSDKGVESVLHRLTSQIKERFTGFGGTEK